MGVTNRLVAGQSPGPTGPHLASRRTSSTKAALPATSASFGTCSSPSRAVSKAALLRDIMALANRVQQTLRRTVCDANAMHNTQGNRPNLRAARTCHIKGPTHVRSKTNASSHLSVIVRLHSFEGQMCLHMLLAGIAHCNACSNLPLSRVCSTLSGFCCQP